MSEKERVVTLGELADHIADLLEEHGDGTRVRTNADGVMLPNVAISYEEDDDTVVFH